MRGIAIRKQLTNEWKKRGVKEEGNMQSSQHWNLDRPPVCILHASLRFSDASQAIGLLSGQKKTCKAGFFLARTEILTNGLC